MGDTKSRLDNDTTMPNTVLFTTEEKLEFLANIIVDRIIEDQATDQELLKHIRITNAPSTIAVA